MEQGVSTSELDTCKTQVRFHIQEPLTVYFHAALAAALRQIGDGRGRACGGVSSRFSAQATAAVVAVPLPRAMLGRRGTCCWARVVLWCW
jgi:hypothetical protein